MTAVFQYLEEFNAISVFLRLFLAVTMGGVIGWERGNNRQSAGMRTFALVCLGAAIAMVTNDYLTIKSGGNTDTGRMAAQVISGIGFLGAGTIIVTGKSQVRGLTTAAGLWATATLGIAIGAGFLYGAILAFAFIMISVGLLQNLSKKQEGHNRVMEVYMEINPESGMLHMMEFIKQKEYIIRSMQRNRQKTFHSEDVSVTLVLDLKKQIEHDELMNEMQKIKGIHYIEEVR